MFHFQDFLDYALPIFLTAVGVWLAVRVLAGFLDWWRIASYVRRNGGQLVACRWWPWGPGWLGERRARIYYVAFIDQQGARPRAYCKTSLLSGVYFTKDRVA